MQPLFSSPTLQPVFQSRNQKATTGSAITFGKRCEISCDQFENRRPIAGENRTREPELAHSNQQEFRVSPFAQQNTTFFRPSVTPLDNDSDENQEASVWIISPSAHAAALRRATERNIQELSDIIQRARSTVARELRQGEDMNDSNSDSSPALPVDEESPGSLHRHLVREYSDAQVRENRRQEQAFLRHLRARHN